MSDIRFRLLTLVLLSVLSFVSLFGAAAVFCWWIVFGAKTTFAKNSWKVVIPVSIFVGLFPSVVLYFTGGDVFYGAKIFVLVLLAFWFSASLLSGELMSFFVWVFGQGSGFDLGMAAEFSVQAISEIREDFLHMWSALRIKGQKFSVLAIPSLAAGLLILSLRRAGVQSSLLARRGYISGGTYVPVFSPAVFDFLMLGSAVFLYGVLLV
ncbi:MAG: hypothetical protein Q7J08_04505 [Methanocorpusculum sp.]|uniref:hypothetical protein n=1 Tax=Methanocorpusculum sp. TaxID=2058474 RepID=UPI002720C222|nr:hypothetical protein [Methanocorpusculum sp.]MDO9522957.1 hypothetical protein [Methanocorpusculum sp.]